MPRNRALSSTTRARNARQTPSVAEQIVWRLLRNLKTGFKFRREHELEGFRLDFYCHEALLVVEMDGEQHNPIVDSQRDAMLAQHGLLVHRIPNRRFFGIDEDPYKDEIGEIQKLCEERTGRKAYPD